MSLHSCLLCMGSNFYRTANMAYARRNLQTFFPDIRFSREMETEAIGSIFFSPFSNQVAAFTTSLSADEVRAVLKEIEQKQGRLPEEKARGIVKIDLDLLKHDDCVLKPQDWEKAYVQEGMEELR